MGEKIDRLAMRGRAAGEPIMHQRWDDLLFLHWEVDPALLRKHIPDSLEIDTFEGKAYVGITPFHLDDLRPSMLPSLPGLSSFEEINVRTYVIHKGVPGIWFFSLDASKLLPVVAAKLFFMLPYHKADVVFRRRQNPYSFDLLRTGSPPAEFKASWEVGNRLRDPDKESLAFFLVERYCAFAVEGQSVYQIRIYHRPWILEEAVVNIEASTMLEAAGIQPASLEPIVYFSRSLEVEVWAPQRVKAPYGPVPQTKVPVT